MSAPLIGVSAWTRTLHTSLGEGRHHTLAVENVDAVVAAGGAAVICPPQRPEHAPGVVGRIDALVLSGGGDVDPDSYGATNERSEEVDSDRDRWELALVDAALAVGTPILGICRGIQIVNVAMGGTLTQHLWGRDDHPPLDRSDGGALESHDHRVAMEAGSRLATILGPEPRIVNSYHHQGVDEVGSGLAVSATADDGTVEALESADAAVLGVQWHPELMSPDDHGPLFRDLLRRI